MPAKKTSGKTMDVTNPTAAPESSGRPIIVTNRPLLQDPMVTDSSTKTSDDEPKPTPGPLAGSSKKIQPLSDTAPETTTEEPAADAESSETEEVPEESTSANEDKTQAAVVDAVVAGSTKSTEQLADDVESAKQEKVQQLIESKKYVVPLGQVTKRKQHQQSVVILVVLLLIVGAYLAADFGLIPLPFELPLQFVK